MLTVIHLMDRMGDLDAPLTLVTMHCGEAVLIDPEGFLHPPHIDFVQPPDPLHLVDCAECLARMALDRRALEATA